jgi:predicted HTH domain antitoxin
LTLELPEDLAAQLAAGGRDLSRAALVALAIDEYRSGRLTDAQFPRLLGVTRLEADELLKSHGVWLDYTLDDFEREGQALRTLRERHGG